MSSRTSRTFMSRTQLLTGLPAFHGSERTVFYVKNWPQLVLFSPYSYSFKLVPKSPWGTKPLSFSLFLYDALLLFMLIPGLKWSGVGELNPVSHRPKRCGLHVFLTPDYIEDYIVITNETNLKWWAVIVTLNSSSTLFVL